MPNPTRCRSGRAVWLGRRTVKPRPKSGSVGVRAVSFARAVSFDVGNAFRAARPLRPRGSCGARAISSVVIVLGAAACNFMMDLESVQCETSADCRKRGEEFEAA